MSTIAYTFPARFAGLDLEIVTWTEDLGRTVVQHEPARGNGAQLSDRGQDPRTYTLTLQLTGTPDEVAEKRDALVALRATGETRVFEHPLDGLVRCKLSALAGSLAAGNVTYTATLVEDLAFTRRFAQGEVLELVSLQDVEITADDAEAALASLELEGPDIMAAAQRAQTWTERAQEDIAADVSAMRAEVAATVQLLDKATGVAEYQAAVALEAFRGSYERYARSVTAIQGPTFALSVAQPLPLVVVLTSLYGARAAPALLDSVARINDIADAARLVVGRQLTLPRAP